METINKRTIVKNSSISFEELEIFNNLEVEVIVFPSSVSSGNQLKKQKEFLSRFKGCLDLGFADTTEKLDKLVFGK